MPPSDDLFSIRMGYLILLLFNWHHSTDIYRLDNISQYDILFTLQLKLKNCRDVRSPINYFGGFIVLITWVGMLFVFTPFFILALMIIFTGKSDK